MSTMASKDTVSDQLVRGDVYFEAEKIYRRRLRWADPRFAVG